RRRHTRSDRDWSSDVCSSDLGGDGLKRLVNACHAVNIAVILDVVYQHVDPTFPYKLVYDALNNQAGPPHVPSPMIGGDGLFGPRSEERRVGKGCRWRGRAAWS